MKVLVVVPTLNEKKNIFLIIQKIFSLYPYDVLVIDDNSTDGTYNILQLIKKKYKKFNFIVRKNKNGIGSAHLDGINLAYKNKYHYCITMDADGTHDPINIADMINVIKKKSIDVVGTSRFLEKDSLKDWPYFRIVITKVRYYLVKLLLNTKYDSSGGFRCYNLRSVNQKIFKLITNKNYFFLIESMYLLEKKGYKILDIAIKLKFRSADQSKMRIFHIFESFYSLIKLRFKKI